MHPKVVCFGEVLWDVFPDYKRIGGAPLNVSLRLHSLGINAEIISCIGADEKGAAIIEYIQSFNVSTQCIQTNPNLPTGNVIIALDRNKNATYDIVKSVAWDAIEITSSAIDLVQKADCLVFGSLATRSSSSKSTLTTLLKSSKFNVFDVNFRTPFYTRTGILELMDHAHFIKLNDDELDEVCNWSTAKESSIEDKIRCISDETNSSMICVTLAAKGAVLFCNGRFYYNNGFKVAVVDTVGAGDSFLAALLSKLLTNESKQDALDFACKIGAIVASKSGANEMITTEDFKKLKPN